MVKDADWSSGMSFDDVVDILTILDGSDAPTKIDYRNGPLRIRIRRGGKAAAAAGASAAASMTQAASEAPPPPSTDGGRAPTDGVAVSAPIAGVFYRAPSPDADPFVEVGDAVAEDTVIGIVEVMKLMNTVRSGVTGVVTEICAENAALVEYGQPLIRVRAEDITQ